MSEKKKTILVLCTGNSARSQMAEALLKHMRGNEYDVFSSGTKPGDVRPEAIEAIRELGLSMEGYRSKTVDEFAGKEIDFVLTVCDNAKEACPHFPEATKTIHHAFEDPAAVEGDDKTRLDAFRKARDEINFYFSDEFLKEIEPENSEESDDQQKEA